MFSIAYEEEDIFEYQGNTFKIDMSFDNIIKVSDLLLDEDIQDDDKPDIVFYMLLECEFQCENWQKQEMIDLLMKKIFSSDVGESDSVLLDLDGNPMPSPMSNKRVYFSFKYDAEYIFASFYQAYKIDLIQEQGKLHYKKFLALLNGLPENTIFKQIVDIRKKPYPTGKGSGAEKAELKRKKKDLSYPGEDFSKMGEGE